MNDGESTLLSNYSDEQLKLKRQYKSDRDIDKEAYYVFVMSDIPSKTGLAGYMPLKEQYAFIYNGNTDAQTIAHELGHGAFRLWHTFSSESDYYMAEKSSDNLMDYNEGEELHKYQWNFIHDPASGLYLFQDEEEAAYVEYTIDKDAEGGSAISIECHTFFTPAGYPITFNTEKLLEINSKDFVSNTESHITVPNGALFKFSYDGERYRAIYKKSENKFYGYRQDDDHSIIYKESITKLLNIPHPINVFIDNEVKTRISKWDINNSQVYTGNINEYKGEGLVATMIESQSCGALLFEYQNSPLMENDVFRRLILEDPCILEGASIHIADIILPGDESYMKVFSAALAVAFAPVAIEYLIVPLLESLPTLGSEEAVRRSAQFITGASVDAILQAAINYYFVLEENEQTWENAVYDIELLEVGASGVEAMFDTWLVEMVSSCMVDGFTQDGELKAGFDGKDCVKGALSALLIRGVLSGGSKAIKKLNNIIRKSPNKFINGITKLDISKEKVNEIAKRLGIKFFNKKPSWNPNRIVYSDIDDPVAFIGNYNLDTKEYLQELNYPKTSNFDLNVEGVRMLNVPEEVWNASNDPWKELNEVWLKNTSDSKLDILVLSDKNSSQLLERIECFWRNH